MAADYFDVPADSPDRRAFITEQMARLRLDTPKPGHGPDPKLALAKADDFWGLWPGATLGAEWPGVEFTVGDDAGED